MDMPPFDACYAAFRAKDARYDGRLFVGVTSTGIYCRPICPVRTPKPAHCRFYASAAAAQGEGFRPCRRCRPEISPMAAAWRGSVSTVSRALSLISAGVMDGGAGLTDLCGSLGVGERQLRRLFHRHLGASPLAVAQTRRLLAAKQLLTDSDLSISAIAAAAGFASLRRFNDAFRDLYAAPPSALRGRIKAAGRRGGEACIHLRLTYRPPYDWQAAHAYFAARAIDGVEYVEADRYARAIDIDGVPGTVAVSKGRGCLEAEIGMDEPRALLAIHDRLRSMFDLDADRTAIGAHLTRDSRLAPLVAGRPGLPLVGAWDRFEQLVRAIIGQQISVAAARRLCGLLCDRCGRKLQGAGGDARLLRCFPTPAGIAAADLTGFPMPRARIKALQGVARAVADNPHLLYAEDAEARLAALPGIGPWTVQYWSLRVHRDGDAFPAGDIVLRRNFAKLSGGDMPDRSGLCERAQGWRPWRAYAAQYLWTEQGEK